MRISALEVANFKAVRAAAMEALGSMVVVAGANGSGKTCILDAIRLLKIRLASDSVGDWTSWLSEFQIDPASRSKDRSLFRDPSQPIRVSAIIELDQSEYDYTLANARSLIEEQVWREKLNHPELNQQSPESLAAQFPHLVGEIGERTNAKLEALVATAARGPYNVSLVEWLDRPHDATVDPILQLALRARRPRDVGTIEYFGATRNYQREGLGGISVAQPPARDPYASHGVVNWQAKLSNVKTELATSYVRALIQAQASGGAEVSALDETLKDLFTTFFPDKEYLGVTPTAEGWLDFPVRLSTGESHDINELSAGEKEIVYGYLRLRTADLRHSIILMDEPELHLNPALLQGLPEFYSRNLVSPGSNQMWLVTHSDAILRQVVQNPAYSVVHLQQATLSAAGANQAQPVLSNGEVERVLIDLVGDLALYRPKGRVVIFEGGGNSDFDVDMTTRLFPDLPKVANLVSAGGKRRVSDLYEVLKKASESGALSSQIYAITDRDSDPDLPEEVLSDIRSWDVYHIENYLLEPKFVAQSINQVVLESSMSEDEALAGLLACARELIDDMVAERIATKIERSLVASVKVGGPKVSSPIHARLGDSISATFSRIHAYEGVYSDPAQLEAMAEEIRAQLESALTDGSWVKEFRGRDILRRFTGQHAGQRMSYEGFRNLVISAMAGVGHRPAGMAKVLLTDFGLMAGYPTDGNQPAP